ncbi:MAG: hypothetical protein QOJ80_113, partial [Mycobacterium sp.]|nr:hypothetical protein [Mycobacterium sp.]
MTAVLPQLRDAVEVLEAVDAHRLTDGELHDTVVALVELDSRLAAARARLLAVWDARQVWADDGSRSAASRLSRDCNVSSKTGKRELARARGLAALPATSAGLRDGKLSVDQADLLRWANQPDIAEVFAREEQFLIDLIVGLRLDDARRAVDYWIDRAYEEVGTDRPYRFRAGRHVQIGRTFQGTVDLKGRLDPLAGTEVMAELTRIERKLFEQDWAAAKAEHGPNALPSHLP